MLGNFTYCNPTRLHFGEQALEQLAGELKEYGGRVLLAYGGGSIKKTGLYEKVRHPERLRQGSVRGAGGHAQPHGGKAL